MSTPGAPLGIESAGKQQAMAAARTKPVWCVTFVRDILIIHANNAINSLETTELHSVLRRL